MKFKELYHQIFAAANEVTVENAITFRSNKVDSIFNAQYGDDAKNNTFDLHFPKGCNHKLPTVVFVHGGGYVAGQKQDLNRYVRVIAEAGYCVVNMEYTKVDGVELKYFPTPVFEVFDLFKVLEKDPKFANHIDFNNIFLAGDSAGAHIVSLVANIQTNPMLKQDFNLFGGPKVKGLILTCPVFGEYGFMGKEFKELLYGKKNPLEKLCNNHHLFTDKFPPSILTSTPNDFVAMPQVKSFIKMAKKNNLSVRHCEVQSGYKLFHDSMMRYADKYPILLNEVCNFIEDTINDKLVDGVHKKVIKEKRSGKNVDKQNDNELSFE